VRGNGAVLLLSGLPLDRKPSFYRQLDSLAAVWRQRRRSVFLGGPVCPDPESRMRQSAWGGEAAPALQWRLEGSAGKSLCFEALVAPIGPEAVIALGYPDQFPFLHGAPIPCYLWAQFSRPPRQVLPETPIYIPLTQKTASHLRAVGCCKIGPIIPHGVDTRRFSPLSGAERKRLRRPHGCADTFVVGTVGNNSRRKRLDLIVRSFALLSRHRSASRLLIKTNRPASPGGVDLPALIAREDVGDKVEIIATELGEGEMVELYNRMDLFLNLSEWEGFCIPVIEAMACGVPVLSPPIQGPGEILPYSDTLVAGGLFHQQDGTLLYQADPQAVCRVLVALADGRRLGERLRRAGRDAALSRYDIRRIAAQWEDVFQRM